MESKEHEVDFSLCKTCIHIKVDEADEPCNECLLHPYAPDSRRPIKYAENKKNE